MENIIFGGGYTCNVCGQYQRTSALCKHFNLIDTNVKHNPNMKTLEDFFINYSIYFEFEEGEKEYLVDKDNFKKAMIEFTEINSIKFAEWLNDSNWIRRPFEEESGIYLYDDHSEECLNDLYVNPKTINELYLIYKSINKQD